MSLRIDEKSKRGDEMGGHDDAGFPRVAKIKKKYVSKPHLYILL